LNFFPYLRRSGSASPLNALLRSYPGSANGNGEEYPGGAGDPNGCGGIRRPNGADKRRPSFFPCGVCRVLGACCGTAGGTWVNCAGGGSVGPEAGLGRVRGARWGPEKRRDMAGALLNMGCGCGWCGWCGWCGGKTAEGMGRGDPAIGDDDGIVFRGCG
jgi:hypothetical protein